MSRAKTFKKSLRQSFRRLRKRRNSGGEEQAKSPKASPKKTKPESPKKEAEKKEGGEQGASSIEAPATGWVGEGRRDLVNALV